MNSQFYTAVAQLVDGEALDIVRNCPAQNGLEAWLAFFRDQDPLTRQTQHRNVRID